MRYSLPNYSYFTQYWRVVQINVTIPAGRRDDKNNKNRKLPIVTASNAENFANKTQLLDCFYSWVNYHLLSNPNAKGIKRLASTSSCQQNGPQAESHQSVFGSL
jgi:hypothetical protein